MRVSEQPVHLLVNLEVADGVGEVPPGTRVTWLPEGDGSPSPLVFAIASEDGA